MQISSRPHQYRFVIPMITLLVMSVLTMAVSNASAQERDVHMIAAVVNEDVVTIGDIEQRMNLIIYITGMEDSDEVRRRLFPQVVKSLMDEAMQQQDASSKKIIVDDKEIQSALQSMIMGQGKSEDELERQLQSRHIYRRTLEKQIEAQLLWQKVVNKYIRPNVRVGEREIDESAEAMRKGRSVSDTDVRLDLRQILLEVPGSNAEESAANAPEVAKQLRRLGNTVTSCADFEIKAKQVDTSGQWNIGEVTLSSLPDALRDVLGKTEKGNVTPPFLTSQGMHMMMVCDKTMPGETQVNREAIRNTLFQKKLVLEVERYMRDLQRTAFVEVRL